ncbi:MAG: ribulose-phosphate 3-epimerase [Candidatus Omnitrophota bacterium]
MISASLLDVKVSYLAAAAQQAWRAGLDMFHIDHMDGEFVPHKANGLIVMQAINKIGYGSIYSFQEQQRAKKKPMFDVHLMVKDVSEQLIEDYIDQGAAIITFHFETSLFNAQTAQIIIQRIREVSVRKKQNVKVGISIKPKTDNQQIYPILDKIDQVLIMAVEPGAGGQQFLPEILNKISGLRRYIDAKGYNVKISVDGGVTRYYAQKAVQAGADIITVGSTIFKQAVSDKASPQNATIADAINALRNASVSKAIPLDIENQKNIVEDVILQLEQKLKDNFLANNEKNVYEKILQRYYKYREKLSLGQRITLPKYFYGVSQEKNGKLKNDLTQAFSRKKLPFEFISYGNDGVMFYDRIITEKIIEKKLGKTYLFRDYNLWISLPSDIELEGQVVYIEDENGIGKKIRFTTRTTIKYPDYGILLNPKEINSIIISDAKTLLKYKYELMNLPMVKKYNIPVIGIKEAQVEIDFLDKARQVFDRFNMIKEGKYDFDWIKERPLREHNLKEFNLLKQGEIVFVDDILQRYYGYITVENNRKFVTYLNTNDPLTSGLLNQDNFTRKKIVMITDFEDRVKHAGSMNIINFNLIQRTNTTIDLQQIGSKNFLEYLIEIDEQKNKKSFLEKQKIKPLDKTVFLRKSYITILQSI